MLTPDLYSALLPFRNGDLLEVSRYDSVIRELVSSGFLELIRETTNVQPDGSIGSYRLKISASLTCDGCRALREHEFHAQNKADEKRDGRRNRVWEIVMLLLGVAVGLLVDHFAEILAFIKKLFS